MPFRGCLANYDLLNLLRLSRDNSGAALHAFYTVKFPNVHFENVVYDQTL